MDVGGEQSQNEAENEASWVPMTPQKPNLGGNMQFASSQASASTSGGESFTHWVSANNARMSNKKLYFETMNRWKGFSCQELLFQAEAGTIMPSPTQSSEPKCQIPKPHHHSYDLNLSPEATFSILHGKSIPKFAPLTPDKSTRVDNSDVDTRDCDTEKQKNQTTTAMEIVSEPDNDGQSPRPATESSLMVDCTKLQEKQNSDKGDGQVIDLNKTPQQKQRRKKHRPKVITERKPRTPKPKTPNLADSKKNTTGKRKYVRKNRNEIASDTPPEVAGQFSDSKTRTPRKRSCKRTLNFEEKQPEAEDSTYSSSKVNLEVNLEWQGPNFCTSKVSKSTIQVCSSIEEVLARNKQEGAIYHETAGTLMLDKDRPPCPMSPDDSNCSTSVNLTQGQEQAKVPMGNYQHVLKVADSGSVNMNGALYNSLHEYEVSWLNNKKRRTDKGQNNTTQSIIFCSTTKDRCRVSAASGQAGKGLQENLSFPRKPYTKVYMPSFT